MSDIRLTYSGLITFSLLLVSVFTGLVFTLIVTRRLEQTEFGLWSLIGGMIAYSLIFSPVSNYWVRRHIARNEPESITGLFSALLFSIVGVVIYFIAIIFISEFSDANYQILILAVLLVPLSYIIRSFSSITSSYKPQGTAFAMLVFELTKIPLGFLLVYLLDMGVAGAIITAIISHLAQISFYFSYIRDKLKETFHFHTFKQWLKLSWLPVISTLHDRIIHLDSTIFTLISGSVIGVSYVGVARVIGNLVSNTSSISVGLAPKLLATQKVQFTELMLDRTLLFAIPMLGFSLVFAKAGVWILNPIYIDGVMVVYLWSFIHFTWVIYGIFTGTMQGMERVDIGFKANFRMYLKSKLFAVPLVYVIGYSAYIIMLIITLLISETLGIDTIETVFWWGIVGLIANVAILITFWSMATKMVSFKFPIKKSVKYILVTVLVSTTTSLLLTEYLEYNESIFEFGPQLIPYLLLFAGMYFGIILVWDKDVRILFRQIFGELKK